MILLALEAYQVTATTDDHGVMVVAATQFIVARSRSYILSSRKSEIV